MEAIAQFHPIVVHFPIVLFIIYMLFEIAGVVLKNEFYSKAAYILLILGVVSAIGAVLTGNQAEEVAEHWLDKGIGFGDVLEAHEEYAIFTLWYFFAILVARTYFVVKKKFVGTIKIVFAVLALVGTFLVFETGEHGGELVFKYGVGTEVIQNSVTE